MVWVIALIITVGGVSQVTPASLYLQTEADCHKFGEIWERTFAEVSGAPPSALDHICVEVKGPGVDV